MERLTVNDLDKVCYDPWDLCGMESHCTKGCHEEGGCTKGCLVLKMYRKLAEYEDLEEQGKLLKLPCAVGNTVYRPYINTVIEMKVASIVVQHIIQIYYCGTSYRSVIEDFGKAVFLTREEAEAALKET